MRVCVRMVYKCTFVHTRVCVSNCVCTRVCLCVSKYMFAHACVYVGVCVCVCTRACVGGCAEMFINFHKMIGQKPWIATLAFNLIGHSYIALER